MQRSPQQSYLFIYLFFYLHVFVCFRTFCFICLGSSSMWNPYYAPVTLQMKLVANQCKTELDVPDC